MCFNLLTTLPSGQHWWIVALKGFPPQQESAFLSCGCCNLGDFIIDDVATSKLITFLKISKINNFCFKNSGTHFLYS